jgi:hypothetical protein
MKTSDQPTWLLARLYHYVWLATIVLLAAAGAIHIIGKLSGATTDPYAYLQQMLVQGYLILVPLAILAFAILMTIAKSWTLALTSYVLSLIWIGAKLLG